MNRLTNGSKPLCMDPLDLLVMVCAAENFQHEHPRALPTTEGTQTISFEYNNDGWPKKIAKRAKGIARTWLYGVYVVFRVPLLDYFERRLVFDIGIAYPVDFIVV